MDKGDKQTEVELDVLPPSEGGVDAPQEADDKKPDDEKEEAAQEDDKDKDDTGDNAPQ